ncbi:MAG: septal ring lytic transglycosylase RlpA family protein [Terracidiphilus sp.]
MPTWALVSVSCVALAVAALTFTTGTVEADALLSVAKQAPVATSATPAPAIATQANEKPAKTLHGMASWYGPTFNGQQTASGEQFDMYAMTAAQPDLPFGTRVRVENLVNHRRVVVKINDRGYLPHRRVLDLSYGAAEKLAMTDRGLAPVKITVLPPVK